MASNERFQFLDPKIRRVEIKGEFEFKRVGRVGLLSIFLALFPEARLATSALCMRLCKFPRRHFTSLHQFASFASLSVSLHSRDSRFPFGFWLHYWLESGSTVCLSHSLFSFSVRINHLTRSPSPPSVRRDIRLSAGRASPASVSSSSASRWAWSRVSIRFLVLIEFDSRKLVRRKLGRRIQSVQFICLIGIACFFLPKPRPLVWPRRREGMRQDETC